ncbi:MAG: type II toxin-antitoxin system HicA family toxin [Verrucomicrobia bacterium]|nr:type II toxin-antitoxin system HicA family toxin [Verrucomicrobiota bacterium]MCH8511769.1 type II toxin-antitoxin system HicA family toxin [Kiritimatiellia bacterium]
MPKKIRELIRALKDAGFTDRGGKGSHRNFTHPQGGKITLSGNPSHDAKRYQERDVEKVLREVNKK